MQTFEQIPLDQQFIAIRDQARKRTIQHATNIDLNFLSMTKQNIWLDWNAQLRKLDKSKLPNQAQTDAYARSRAGDKNLLSDEMPKPAIFGLSEKQFFVICRET